MAEKITPEQLAAADQLNQKLQQGEVNAQQYAAALKEAGLELANQINLIDQKIGKLNQMVAEQGASEEISQRLTELESQRNDLVAGGEAGRKKALQDALRQRQLQRELNDELQNSFGFMEGFIQNLAEGGDSMEFLASKATELGKSLVDDFMLAFGAAALNGFASADKLTTQFNQLTGTAGSMNGVILNAAGGMSAVGVSTEMAAGAASELYQQFNQFSSANADLKTDMIQTTASLERLGVSSAVTAKNIDLASNAFGMGAQQATQLQDDLAKTAMAIGMPPAKLAEEFGKAAPQLAAYGKEGIEVFKNMAAASKGLGVEMGTLLGLTEKMDTFEGAAESAGRLNAMLGGDLLNSMDLLNATEDERIRMVLQSVEASGRSFDAMGKFERKQLAATVGITDMAEANKLFGGGLAAYDDAQAKMAENAKTEEELAAAKAASVSVTEKLSLMFDKMTAAMAPVVNAAHNVMNVLLAVNDATGGWLVPTLGIVIGMFILGAKVMGTYNAIMTALAIRKGALATVSGLLTTAQTAESVSNTALGVTSIPAAVGTTAVGTAAWYAAIPVALLAIGIGMLALGIGLVAIAIAGIVWAFVYLISLFMEAPMAAVYAAGAFVIMGLAVAGLAIVFALLAPIAPIAMAAMIMLGIGMMFLSVPMLLLAGSFAIFAAALAMLPGGAAVALASLGLAMIPFAFSLLLAAPAMFLAAILFAPSALLIGTALMFLGIGVSLLSKYSSSLPTMGENLREFAIGLRGASWRMFLAAIFFAPSALILGVALMALGFGIGMLVKHRRSMKTLGKNLPEFAQGLLAAAPFLALAGILLGIAAYPFLIGAIALTIGMMVMAHIPAEQVFLVSQQLAASMPLLMEIAIGLLQASPILFIASIFFFFASFMLAYAAPMFLFGAILISFGMMILNQPLREFTITMLMLAPIVPQLFAIAFALMFLGFALPIFGMGLFILGLLASLPFVGVGLGVMSAALYIFADAVSGIPTEKAIALGQIFAGLSALTDLEGIGDAMADIAWGIWRLSWALSMIPERRLVRMGVAMEGLEPLGELGKNLTPEVAVSAGNLVDEAERYVEVQAQMKSTKDDAFAQMITASAKATQARAEADKASAEAGGGQDVVLVLNERELGRAVEAILNKRVNLAIS